MEVEITIEKLGQEGHGVGSDAEGNVYFVPRALPGDRVRVMPEETGKRYKDAQLLEVLSPSPHRVAPACPHFADCGGCDFLHFDYTEQLRFKDQIVDHSLSRNGLVPKVRAPIAKADSTLGYRNRVQFRTEGSRIGFFRRRTHEVVDIDSCAVAETKINEWLKDYRNQSEYPSEKLEVFLGREGSVHTTHNEAHSAQGFAQINEAQNQKLVQMVREQMKAAHAERVLELFCGNGNLTSAYASEVQSIVGVDSNARALEWARKDYPSGTFLRKLVTKDLVRQLPPDVRGHYDTLLLDPPRRGIGTGILSGFVHPELRNVISVSCSVRSFTMDSQALLRKGFTLEWLGTLDMFPNTKHVELVARFSRLQ